MGVLFLILAEVSIKKGGNRYLPLEKVALQMMNQSCWEFLFLITRAPATITTVMPNQTRRIGSMNRTSLKGTYILQTLIDHGNKMRLHSIC